MSKGKIPFYLVFISCPYNDYDVSHTPKQSILEFKNWDQICKLLEKLIKFYVGDVNLKEVKQNVLEQATDKDKGNKIRDQVKKIMEKILGSNSRRPAVSQLQNGIKGNGLLFIFQHDICAITVDIFTYRKISKKEN